MGLAAVDSGMGPRPQEADLEIGWRAEVHRWHPAGQAISAKNRSPESKRKSLICREIEK